MTLPGATRPWVLRAACVGRHHLFLGLVPGEGPPAAERRHALARHICAGCPVASECLDWARRNDVDGVCAGTSRRERQAWQREHLGHAVVWRSRPLAVDVVLAAHAAGRSWNEIVQRLLAENLADDAAAAQRRVGRILTRYGLTRSTAA